jgi:hypothetical protein
MKAPVETANQQKSEKVRDLPLFTRGWCRVGFNRVDNKRVSLVQLVPEEAKVLLFRTFLVLGPWSGLIRSGQAGTPNGKNEFGLWKPCDGRRGRRISICLRLLVDLL